MYYFNLLELNIRKQVKMQTSLFLIQPSFKFYIKEIHSIHDCLIYAAHLILPQCATLTYLSRFG